MQDTKSLLDEFIAIAEAATENDEWEENINEKTVKRNTLTNQNEDELFLEKISTFTQSVPSTSGIQCEKELSLSSVINKQKSTILHNGDTDSSDDESNRDYQNSKYNECGKDVKHLLSEQTKSSVYDRGPSSWKQKRAAPSKTTIATQQKVVPFLKIDKSDIYTDPFFGIRISKPLISSVVLQERMANRVAVSMAKAKEFVTRENNPEDWVISGVIVAKSPVKTSSKGTQYLIWTLSDLKDDLKSVGMFLFGSAYKNLWKTTVGTVLGVLNPSVMDQRDGSKDQATLSVDNPQKVMIFGQSKDYGTCKSKKKDGEKCTAFVNTNKCEYCTYHIRQEYQKLSKRSELQANFAGRGLTALRNKVLGKNEVFYAGKSYMAIPAKKNAKQIIRDTSLLRSLSSQVSTNKSGMVTSNGVGPVKNTSAQSLEVSRAQRLKDLKLLQKLTNEETPKEIIEIPNAKNNFNDALNIDKALLCAEDILKDIERLESTAHKKIELEDISNGSGKLKINEKGDKKSNMKENLQEFDFLQSEASTSKQITYNISNNKNQRINSATKPNRKNLPADPSTSKEILTEHLGNDIISPSRNNSIPRQNMNISNLNKFSSNVLQKSNLGQNSIFNSEECQEWLKKAKFLKPAVNGNAPLDLNISIPKTNVPRVSRANLKALNYVKKNGPIKKEEEKPPKKSGVKRFLEDSSEDLQKKKSKLADDTFTSQRFKQIMSMTSKHTNLLETEDREKEEKYFKKLEIKEKLEEKMMTVFKMDCKAVKCLTCKYTNFSAADRCKTERHVIKVIDAVKRFFKCGKCGNRTVSLQIIPILSCTNCGGSKWERTTMMREKTAHVGENLSIRGMEEKYVGAINTGGNINLLVPDET